MAADLEDYDFDDLDSLPENHVMILVLASYGEGEPTDNAEAFYAFITERADDAEALASLSNLNYAAFGLGNSSYEQYNAVVRRIDEALKKMGANSLCPTGEGDDGEGMIEDDFLAWKEIMWSEVAKVMSLEERAVRYEPSYNIKLHPELTTRSPAVYLGELTGNRMKSVSTPYGASNPYVSVVVESDELFRMPDRNCIHMEFDITGSGMSYETGDHVAIWPMNPTIEVDRFLALTDLADKRDQVVSLEPIDGTSRLPFPSPTTYDSIARYYLEICGPVSRQFVSTLVPFSPDEPSRVEMEKLANDAEYFSEIVSKKLLNIAQLLEMVGDGKSWGKNLKEVFGDQFELIMAFSREGPKKVYVQDRLLEHANAVNELLEQSGHFYVCGDAANMAHAVASILHRILVQQRGISESLADNLIKQMRLSNKYQEDTW
ncbi:related to NADPH-ferrihemoprotein reductase [Cephalotrichum gorgonifer]|uniref:NADPH--hemoprotein reductase n=1 Tax=Cephalotrichum gorgonifer TaxID=2041049 RepID=A0AAE8N738_9PEZI|nr:related to NADPH-ferrihemoprotein reductase [Cephalotrichum gorgonifer]